MESTNIKVMEHGKAVLLLEKASLGKYLVVKGTPDKMLDHLLAAELEGSSQEGDWSGCCCCSVYMYIVVRLHVYTCYIRVLRDHSLITLC